MRKNWKVLTVVLAAAVVFFGFKAINSEGEKERVVNELIYSLLTSQHYQPRKLNDELSVQVYDLYFEGLDYNKRFFTKPEMDHWKSKSTQLDDFFAENNLTFFDETYGVFTKRLNEVHEMVDEILESSIDISKVCFDSSTSGIKYFLGLRYGRVKRPMEEILEIQSCFKNSC